MGYVIMIMAWSSGSLWIAGSDKISGYCERSEKRVTVNGVNSNTIPSPKAISKDLSLRA